MNGNQARSFMHFGLWHIPLGYRIIKGIVPPVSRSLVTVGHAEPSVSRGINRANGMKLGGIHSSNTSQIYKAGALSSMAFHLRNSGCPGKYLYSSCIQGVQYAYILVWWFIPTPQYKAKGLFRSYMLCVPSDESHIIFNPCIAVSLLSGFFFIWDIQFWAGLCLVRRYFFTFEIHWMSHMMWNSNLHIPYFWSEFPGRNVTHPAGSAYGMCLREARSCRELLAVSSSDGKSFSRLPVPSLLCTLTDPCWGVWKI